MDIGVELQTLTDEHEGADTRDVECSPDSFVRIGIHKAGRALLLDGFNELLDQFAGLIFFGEIHAEAGHRLGDVVALLIMNEAPALKQHLIELFARYVEQALPDRIAVFGWAEGEQAKRTVCDAVVGLLFGECLMGNASGAQVNQVKSLKFGLPGGPVELSDCQSCMSGLIES
ncbi:MAG: hypothetical protein BWY82_02034 [Verrucomicrobia bacterium ADurb.Bin474]|nr:MAG: hypothetical protein BWY82_02034 [Verrucomicrobia bacterium ADurb.Bin474]